MPTAVAAARQSYADHPMVRLETAPPGPCHAVSLQETLSGTFTACATVILVIDSIQMLPTFRCTGIMTDPATKFEIAGHHRRKELAATHRRTRLRVPHAGHPSY